MSNETWIHWFVRSVRQQPGRVFCAAFGIGCTAVAFVLLADGPLALLAAFGGMTLTGGALLMNGIESIRIGSGGAEISSRPAGDLGAAITEIRNSESAVDFELVNLPGDDEWDGARFAVGEAAFEHLLMFPPTSLARCDIRILMFDSNLGRLLPVLRPPGSPSRNPAGWRPGEGAVGAAFATNAYVIRNSPATHDGTDDLSPELQAAFSDLASVAAVTLVDRHFNPFGVLSVSTTDVEVDLDTEAVYLDHLDLAAKVSVILLELLVARPMGEG